VVIIDTAGRLSIDEALMDEVRSISKVTLPHYTFLVIDAVTGQDAVVTARAFHETLALSASSSRSSTTTRAVAPCSRRAASSGDRSSSPRPARRWTISSSSTRPDGLTDPRDGRRLSLIEQAEQRMDSDVLAEGAGRMMSGTFTLDDFLAR